MEIVTTIAGSIVGPIFAAVRQEVGYQFSYKSNIHKLRTEVNKLIGDRNDKQRIVEDDRRNNREAADAVKSWFKGVEATIVKANELVDKYNEGPGEVTCWKRPFRNLCVRRRLSKDAEEMAINISALIDEGKSHQVLSFPVPPQTKTSSDARRFEALESRTSTLNEIRQALKDPNINRIGVYGMGGVGKTTLMKELDCQAKTERLFDEVVMVTSITNTPNFRGIQGELADGLGLELKKETLKGRAGELRARISSEKSILIILDDIWDELNLEELGVPYGADHEGCKFVLTSRDHNVLRKKMNTQKEFSLRVFSEGESWNLFEKILGDEVKLQNIKSIAVDVVKCCAGLPLLINVVANDLKNEPDDVRVWNDILTRLQSNDDYKELANCVLRLSYERLKGEELKSLFLLMGSFGQVGIGIHTEELLQVCWGLRIYKGVRTLEEARNRQHKLIKDLRASSLLLDGETEWVRMHDLVHDVAKLIASETRCTYTGERLTKINELQNCHHIILRDYHIGELPKKLEYPKLEVLLLHFAGEFDVRLEISDSFFSEMREVKVLYLSGMKLTNPPQSLCRLVGLRSLNLSDSEMKDISIIGELTRLEILILEKAKKLVELPKKIGDLTNLRMLNVNECLDLTFIPEDLLSSLKCLEELYMRNCPIEWKVEGSNNNTASLDELSELGKLKELHLMIKDGSTLPRDLHKNIERYNISIGLRRDIDPDRNFSRVLMLDGALILTLFTNNDWVEVLLAGVERLDLMSWQCVARDDFMKLGHLMVPELCCLELSGVYTELTNLTLFVKKVSNMPKLETLQLSLVETCKIWEDNLDAHSHVRNLRTLKITGCSRLTSLFPSSVARALAQLKHLEIGDCERLKTIFVQEDIFIDEVILPNLGTVLISKLADLELLWPSHLAPNSYYKLNKVKVSSCPKLSNVLFPSYVLNNLLNLETLDVSKCNELEVIFEIQEQSTVATNQQGPATRLTSLTLFELPNLKHVWSKDPHGILRFENLCMMRVHRCKSLDYCFPFSPVENFQQLQKLTLLSCGIENIFEKNDSNEAKLFSLAKLVLSFCNGLKNIVQPSVVFQNLNELHVFSCDGAVNVMSPTTATSLSKLRVLTVRNSRSIEEIVASENDAGDSPSEITFMKLEELKLGDLSRLKSFCRGDYSFKFPSLKKVFVRYCDIMETFCNGNLNTPSLTVVTTSWPEEVRRWDGDLNATIRSIFSEKISEQGSSLSSLESEDEGNYSLLT